MREKLGTYEEVKDSPEGAVRVLALILEAHSDGGLPMPDGRLEKARYLLKTLGIASGIPEGRVSELMVVVEED